MRVSLFDYHLPQELIAQKQKKPRDHSRLMILDKASKMIRHDYFYNLGQYLTANDVLVFNDSKVFPARIRLANGGEIFLLREIEKGIWEVIGKKIKQLELMKEISREHGLRCQLIGDLPDGHWLVRFNHTGRKFRDILEMIGETPLPPYIKTSDSRRLKQDYQTVFARREGSVAAPTAGFHFTQGLLDRLRQQGIKTEFITLHVGLGTFQPVKTDKIEHHRMHAELAIIDEQTAERLNDYKQRGARIVAVGTTSCRALEALSEVKGKIKAQEKWVDIFIYPPYKFKFVDALITNFHLPKSTLLMLVAALTGRKFVSRAYEEAVRKKYRFFSFGDGMMIR